MNQQEFQDGIRGIKDKLNRRHELPENYTWEPALHDLLDLLLGGPSEQGQAEASPAPASGVEAV